MSGELLSTVLAAKEAALKNTKTENKVYEILDLFSRKGLNYLPLSEKNCLEIRVLLVNLDMRAFVYLGSKLKPLPIVERQVCKEAIESQLRKIKHDFSGEELSQINEVLDSLENP